MNQEPIEALIAKPLTEIEKAELLTAAKSPDYVLSEAGVMLLRRALFQLDRQAEALAGILAAPRREEKDEDDAHIEQSYQRAYDRLALCPDHRDKANGRCIVCVAEERTRQELKMAASEAPHDAADARSFAEAIIASAKRLGITPATASLTGPEVLLLLNDIEQLAARAATSPAHLLNPITLRNATVLLGRLRGEDRDVLQRLLDDVVVRSAAPVLPPQDKSDFVEHDRALRESAVHHGHAAPDLAPSSAVLPQESDRLKTLLKLFRERQDTFTRHASDATKRGDDIDARLAAACAETWRDAGNETFSAIQAVRSASPENHGAVLPQESDRQWISVDDQLPEGSGDHRKLVWLVDYDGMAWIGIRVHVTRNEWFNNNRPELATVTHWMDLPERPAALRSASPVPTKEQQ